MRSQIRLSQVRCQKNEYAGLFLNKSLLFQIKLSWPRATVALPPFSHHLSSLIIGDKRPIQYKLQPPIRPLLRPLPRQPSFQWRLCWKIVRSKVARVTAVVIPTDIIRAFMKKKITIRGIEEPDLRSSKHCKLWPALVPNRTIPITALLNFQKICAKNKQKSK